MTALYIAVAAFWLATLADDLSTVRAVRSGRGRERNAWYGDHYEHRGRRWAVSALIWALATAAALYGGPVGYWIGVGALAGFAANWVRRARLNSRVGR